jgi:hypothetical protein
LNGPVRIGSVTYSKIGKTIYYQGRTFGSLNGYGFKPNFFDEETREEYWISGCKKDGSNVLYSTLVEIDEAALHRSKLRARAAQAQCHAAKLFGGRTCRCPLIQT